MMRERKTIAAEMVRRSMRVARNVYKYKLDEEAKPGVALVLLVADGTVLLSTAVAGAVDDMV